MEEATCNNRVEEETGGDTTGTALTANHTYISNPITHNPNTALRSPNP